MNWLLGGALVLVAWGVALAGVTFALAGVALVLAGVALGLVVLLVFVLTLDSVFNGNGLGSTSGCGRADLAAETAGGETGLASATAGVETDLASATTGCGADLALVTAGGVVVLALARGGVEVLVSVVVVGTEVFDAVVVEVELPFAGGGVTVVEDLNLLLGGSIFFWSTSALISSCLVAIALLEPFALPL
ncbi:unnamed protein product [Ambrosiozyma monospora]|uniref:Unnamed protein product n=1 Tax=Ambrosiozyma monospora TaxID=43982 RepID=A0ACB5UDH5_AMBMO|nr:unnamed protein product [Ambrosiozyma monospora]